MSSSSNQMNCVHSQNDAHKQIDYYKRIAAKAGELRLREAEELSRLIARLRNTEEELRQARDELEQRVAERTLELSKTNAALMREIHERKRASAELAESEKKYRALFEDSPDAMCLTQDGRIIDVNPAWLKLHGYDDSSEVSGRDIIESIYWEDRQKLQKRRDNWPHIQHGGYAVRDICKNGAIVDVEVFSSRIAIKGKQVVLATIHDLTERKRAEAEKRKLEARLRHSDKMEAIGTLAGGVAHDLNNILSGLVSYPELLLLDLPQDSPLRGPIRTIQKSGLKASAIVQDLLTLARRGMPITEAVSLNQVVDEYLNSPECSRMRRFHPDVAIVTHTEPDLLNIMGSAVHLSKALMNMVSNAAEAMPDGGTITVYTQNQYIEKSALKSMPLEEGDYVLLKVTDTGVGIAKTDIGRIFEPFYTKKVMGRSGTGLGMAVVWGTVKDHCGHIEVESVLGEGTQLTLFFPATLQVTRQADRRPSLQSMMGRGEKILVVDDVEDQREIASDILRRLGYSVVAVESGEAALGYLGNHTMDVILLDMIMAPGIDGYETYKRALELNPYQKAIIASGYSKNERVFQACELGASAYLKKPYLLESIAATVRATLDKTSDKVK